MMNKKVAFITGANGFVGSHLVEKLLSKDIEVHCIVRESSNLKWLEGLDINLHKVGISDIKLLHNLFTTYKANYVFHLAGVVKALSLEDYISGNCKPTEIILEACLGVATIDSIVLTSSLAASMPTTVGNPINETSPRSPLTDYGQSKVVQEDLAAKYMDSLPITIIRPPVVYGSRDTEVFLFFQTIKRRILPLIGFGDKSLSLVHVSDLVEGLYLCTQSKAAIGKTYFLGGHKDEYKWQDIAKYSSEFFDRKYLTIRIPNFIVYIIAFFNQNFSKLFGKVAIVNFQKAKEMISESWSCSSDLAKSEIGYNPKVSLEEGIKHTLNWYKSNKWL